MSTTAFLAHHLEGWTWESDALLTGWAGEGRNLGVLTSNHAESYPSGWTCHCQLYKAAMGVGGLGSGLLALIEYIILWSKKSLKNSSTRVLLSACQLSTTEALILEQPLNG